jgi:uncharacterized protein (TIGR02118 family)
VDKIPNFQRYEAARIVATPDGTEPPYYRIFEMYFDDMERLQGSLSTPEGQAAPNDIPNFATGGAKIFISEVTRSRNDRCFVRFGGVRRQAAAPLNSRS